MPDASKPAPPTVGLPVTQGTVIDGWEIQGGVTASTTADYYPVVRDGIRGVLKLHRADGADPFGFLARVQSLAATGLVKMLAHGSYNNHLWEVSEPALGGSMAEKDGHGRFTRLPLPETGLTILVRTVNQALQACHAAGLIHGNLRLSSVFVKEAAGTAYVLGDFAVPMGDPTGSPRGTAAADAGYSAPEVYSGVVGPEVDYYSLGILVWEAATGVPAFAGQDPQLVVRDTIVGRAVDDLMDRPESSTLPPRIRTLILGLLATRHDKRWDRAAVDEWVNRSPVPETDGAETEVIAEGPPTTATIGPDQWKQEFFDGLNTGSTVHLRAGEYRGSIVLRKGIRLGSADTKEPAVLVPADLPSDQKSRALVVEAGVEGSLRNLLFRGDNFSNQTLLSLEAGSWTVDHCEFRGAYDYALVVSGATTAPQVKACKVHGGYTGILVERQAKGTYDQLEVLDHIKNNIQVQDQGTAPCIRKCKSLESKHCGIAVTKGASGVYEDNDIQGNSLANVMVRDHGTDPVFRNNRLHEGKRGGFYLLEGAMGTYEGNDVFGNSSANVEVKDAGTEPRFRVNKVHDGKQGGFSIYGGAGGIYEGNEVFGNTLSNVFVFQSGTAPEFRGNKIHDGKHAGFSIYGGASGDYEDNDIFGNAQANVIVFQPGTSPGFLENKVHSGRQGGFFIHGGAGGSYESNEIFDNAMANVEVLDGGTNPHFRENKIHSCLNEGLFVQNGAGGRFEGNEFNGNGFSTKGLKDAGPGYPSIRIKDPGTQPVFLNNKVIGFAASAFEISKGAGGTYEGNTILDFDKDNNFVFEKKWDVKWGTSPRRKNNTEA